VDISLILGGVHLLIKGYSGLKACHVEKNLRASGLKCGPQPISNPTPLRMGIANENLPHLRVLGYPGRERRVDPQCATLAGKRAPDALAKSRPGAPVA
jgi:hypothetical protein